MKREIVELNPNHWNLVEYKQRVTTKQWKQLLLEGKDSIIFRGMVIKLKAKNLGAGVYEIFKDLDEKRNS